MRACVLFAGFSLATVALVGCGTDGSNAVVPSVERNTGTVDEDTQRAGMQVMWGRMTATDREDTCFAWSLGHDDFLQGFMATSKHLFDEDIVVEFFEENCGG